MAGRTFHPPRHDRENPNQAPVPRGVLLELKADNALDTELYEWAAGRLDVEVRRYVLEHVARAPEQREDGAP